MHFQPGDTIVPQQSNPEPTTPEPVTETQSVAEPQLPPSSPVSEAIPSVAPSVPASQPEASPESAAPAPTEPLPPADDPEAAPTTYWQGDPAESISWTASEFIAHHKSQGWYALVALGAIVAAVLVWWLTKDTVTPGVIILAGFGLAVFAARQPRQLTYQLDPHGLTVGPRHYAFADFRSFSVVPEGAFSSIVFTPLKRFGVLTTIYYDPQDEGRIIDIISRYLPHEDRGPDAIDGLMRRLRF